LGGEAPMVDKQRVLLLCAGNSARSQMAEGLLREIGGDAFEVFSPGVDPSQVRPLAIEVLKELGVSAWLTSEPSQKLVVSV